MTALPILYSFRRCPYAMRARMAIMASGIQVELREVALRDKPPEMVAVSAKATVPVLQLPCGEVIDESIDIMHWALTHHDPEGWLDHVDDTLIAANDGPFKAALDRYKYPSRFGLESGEADRDRAMQYLAAINDNLEVSRYLGGPRMAFTDAALFPFVRQFAATDRPWFDGQAWRALSRWLDGLTASPLFAAIMIRYAPWKAGDLPLLFPDHFSNTNSSAMLG